MSFEFGDFEPEYRTYKTAEIAILPVPYDGTSTWMKGADQGPNAILEASPNMEFYDIETDSEVYRRGITTLAPITEDRTPESMAEAVEERITTLLNDGKFPVILGGEHSVSIGAFHAMAKHYGEISVLQFDAHSDLRDDYHGSAYNHACVMARAQEVATIAQVGIRSTCSEERHNIDPKRNFNAYRIKGGDSDWMQKVSDCLRKNVYITIDLDVFDPAYLPATGTPEPDGLAYRDVMNQIRLINQQHNIIGLDIVELCPNPQSKASDFFAAKLLYQLLSLIFKNR